MSGNTIRASLDEMLMACDRIEEETYGCNVCPLNNADECLQYACLEDIWNTVSAKRLQDFLDVADNLEGEIEEYKTVKAERDAEEQREYDAEIAELTAGFFKDRGLK